MRNYSIERWMTAILPVLILAVLIGCDRIIPEKVVLPDTYDAETYPVMALDYESVCYFLADSLVFGDSLDPHIGELDERGWILDTSYTLIEVEKILYDTTYTDLDSTEIDTITETTGLDTVEVFRDIQAVRDLGDFLALDTLTFSGGYTGVPDESWGVVADTGWVVNVEAKQIRVPDDRWKLTPSHPEGNAIILVADDTLITADGSWNVEDDAGDVQSFDASFVDAKKTDLIPVYQAEVLATVPVLLTGADTDSHLVVNILEGNGYLVFDNTIGGEGHLTFNFDDYVDMQIWEMTDNSIGPLIEKSSEETSLQSIADCQFMKTWFEYVLPPERVLIQIRTQEQTLKLHFPMVISAGE